ncbi:MAG TPA: glycosyltransferase family 2 protein, partial [bacterium]|nr:glycosyltransferase family 2 protein [bacterium]
RSRERPGLAPKTIVVLPVYNEEKMLAAILGRISPRADMVVCVNDGSSDQSPRILERFARGRRGTYVIHQGRNSGMAGALKTGFEFVLYLVSQGQAGPEDLVVTIDADGQHKPEYIPKLTAYLRRRGLDVVLTRRDFSVYPLYKIWGNRFLTWTNSILSGIPYRDVESGLRLLKVKTLEPILRYYTGVKYSCAQEIAFITARQGFKIDNDFKVEIAYYRAGTTVWDGFIVLALSFYTFLRWRLGLGRRQAPRTALMSRSFRRSRRLWGK